MQALHGTPQKANAPSKVRLAHVVARPDHPSPLHLVLRNIAQVGLHRAHDPYRELFQHQVLQVHGLLEERRARALEQ